MASAVMEKTCVVKAKASDSNAIVSLNGASSEKATIYGRDAVVEDMNFLLAIGGKSVVEDNNTKVEVAFSWR